ncbi:MAG: sigma-70 family RNA polymerase sigma factor, partial [Eubacterium sp.]
MLTKKDFEAYTPYVLSAQAGDPEAFSELYKRTYRQQYAMIHKFFNDTHLCEDLLQDVYIKLFQTIGNIEKPHYFIGYLNQITYHTCISYKRKRSFQMENTVEEEMLLDVAETHTPSIPEDQALQVEKIEIFSEGLRQLSDDERYIFLLRFSEKMKLEDIALSTGLSRSTI